MNGDPRVALVVEHDLDSGSGDNPLWTAAEVGAYLRISPKKVYELPIPRVELSARRVRFLSSDVFAFVQRHRRTG